MVSESERRRENEKWPRRVCAEAAKQEHDSCWRATLGMSRWSPPTLRAFERIAWILLLVLLAWHLIWGLDVFHVVSIPRAYTRIMWLLWLYGVYPLAMLYAGAVLLRARSLRRRVRRGNYRFCVRCTYPLAGLPDKHTCPECGKEYRIADVQAQWREWCLATGFKRKLWVR